MTFEIVNICGKWNSKIRIDIYNRGMKIENWILHLTNRIKCDIYIYRYRNWRSRIDYEKWNAIYDYKNWVSIGWIRCLWYIYAYIDSRIQFNDKTTATELKSTYRYSGWNENAKLTNILLTKVNEYGII